MPTVDRPPAGLVRLDGALVPRRRGFVEPHRLTCRYGHRIRSNAYFREDGTLRCKSPCGAFVYVLAFRRGMLFAADVSWAELEHWRETHMTAEDVLAWLGADLPGGTCRAS